MHIRPAAIGRNINALIDLFDVNTVKSNDTASVFNTVANMKEAATGTPTWYAFARLPDRVRPFSSGSLYFSLLNSVGNGVAPLSQEFTVKIYLMTTDWDPTTLTWLTKPAFTGTPITFKPKFENSSSASSDFNEAFNVPIIEDVYGIAGTIEASDTSNDSISGIEPRFAWTNLLLTELFP